MANCLMIWEFGNAPQEYKDLSRHGGDEDWIMYCPAALVDGYWPWSVESAISGEETSYHNDFGHVDRHELPNGDIVIIFAHA